MKLTEHEVVETVEQLSLRRLRVWVRKGWVVPARGAAGHSFDEVDVARIRLVCHLKDELNLNEEAVPVVLSLMDQLYGVRRELKALAQAVDEQPEEIRNRVRQVFRRLADR